MTLAELVRKALTNQDFRLALETGMVDAADIGSTSHEVAAAAIALRFNTTTGRLGRSTQLSLGDLLGNNVFTLPGWRHGPEG